MLYGYWQFVPHGRGDLTLSCGQKDRLCVCAAAADLSHGRNWCFYISEQKRQRKEKRMCDLIYRPPLGGGCRRSRLGERNAYNVSPSVMAFGHATSLAEGGRAAPAGAGNGFPRQCEHWLGMTGRGQSAGAVDVCRGGRFVRPMGIFFTLRRLFCAAFPRKTCSKRTK